MGVFGGYTRWAVVFLIIFVLFFLLCPVGYGYAGGPETAINMTHYDTTTTTGYEVGQVGYGYGYPVDYSESSSS